MILPVAESSTGRLKISEIFYSIQGESNSVGWPTVFVRLTGCPLRCQYCDTSYAFHGGQWWDLPAILKQVTQYQSQFVTVTGGEPLAQAATLSLLRALCERDFSVSLETSGAIDMLGVDPRVVKVMDIKTPDSGEQSKNNVENLKHLTAQDQIKFVLCSKEDYQWAKEQVMSQRLHDICTVLFSPCSEQLAPKLLAEWMLTDTLPVRFQMQIHKILWGNEPGR